MKCAQARRHIALVAGQEPLEAREAEDLRQHLSSCIACRVHQQQLQQSMSALTQAAMPPGYDVRRSVWPKVAVRLQRNTGKSVSFWEGQRWLPVLSMSVAGLLFLAVWFVPPHPGTPGHGGDPALRSVAPFSGTVFPSSSPGEQRLRPSWEAREADKRMKVNSAETETGKADNGKRLFP